MSIGGSDVSSDCLSNSEVLLFLTGKAPTAQGDRLIPHLDVCPACRMAVGEAARELTRSKVVSQIRTFDDGELVGRYRIQRLVGRGGMGEVYEAFDQILLERVALKTVRLNSLDDARAFSRFKAEVQLARQVSHPNVCRVLEFGLLERSAGPGATPETVPYFTMQFLDGETLTGRVQRQGGLDPREVAGLAAQMARGLQAIHDAGIVHRDFKSDNVLLVPDRGEHTRALVTDFGLARVDREGGGDASSVDGVVGTVDYIAPEQVLGSPATAASDVFALGVVIFEMLSGRRPFQGETRLQLALSRVNVEAPSIASLVPGLPPGWEPLLRRCLARQPVARFRNMAEVIEALAAVDVPPSASSTVRVRWRRAHTWPILALAGTLVGAAALLLPRRSPPTPPRASVTAAPPRPADPRPEDPPSVPAQVDPPGSDQRVPAPTRSGSARPSRRPGKSLARRRQQAPPHRVDSPATDAPPARPQPPADVDTIVRPDFGSRPRPAEPATNDVINPFSRP